MSEHPRFVPPEERGEMPLPKTHDYLHRYRGYWDDDGLCRIRVFQEAGRTPVIVASALPENRSTSITNVAEYLAAAVVARHLPGRFEEQDPFHWLEEYPPLRRRERGPVFTAVRFASYTPRAVWFNGVERVGLGKPTWLPMTREQVAALIGEGELAPSWREGGRG